VPRRSRSRARDRSAWSPCSRCPRSRRIEDHGLDRLGAPLDELADPYAQVVSVAVPQRRVDEVDENARHPARLAARRRAGPSGRCPARGRGPHPGAVPIACPVGQREDQGSQHPLLDADERHTNRVIVASANSRRSKRKMARSSPTRNSLAAMNTSVRPALLQGCPPTLRRTPAPQRVQRVLRRCW